MELMAQIEAENARDVRTDHFEVGDMVDIHYWITEGEKRRIQVFTGLVIRMKHGRGVRGTFTVRRIVASLGVERTFPFHSPNVEKVVVTRYGKTRRAKLFYLRNRVGKTALKVPELLGGRRKRLEEEAAAASRKTKIRKRGKKARAEKRAEAAKAAGGKLKLSKRKAKKKRRKSASKS